MTSFITNKQFKIFMLKKNQNKIKVKDYQLNM